jgi:FtsZ-interacting cell division protein YlmF
VFDFGKRREDMSQEPKEPTQEKVTNSGRPPRKEVELFPVLADKKAAPAVTPQQGGNVTRLGTQISIYNPVTFDEALDIVTSLRGRAATTISLDKMKRSDAGRLVDFVSGASAALDGDFHKLTEQVYLFCPSNIRIVAPEKPVTTSTGTKTGAFDFLLGADLGSISAPRKS